MIVVSGVLSLAAGHVFLCPAAGDVESESGVIDVKALGQFLHFDMKAFLDGKSLVVVDCGPWVDFDSKQVVGTKVTVVITEDRTDYRARKDGGTVTNVFEKFAVKVGHSVDLDVGVKVELVNPVGSVYGDYQSNLSCRADDVLPVRASQNKG